MKEKTTIQILWAVVLILGIVIFLFNLSSYGWVFAWKLITVKGWIIYSIAVTMISTGIANLIK